MTRHSRFITLIVTGLLCLCHLSFADSKLDVRSKSPLSTKGDLFTFDTGNQRLPVGTTGQILSADSSTATGLKWANPPSGSGGGGTVTNSGALTSNAVTIGGGGASISTITADTATTHALFSTASSPAFRNINSQDIAAGIFGENKGGTGFATYTKGDLLVSTGGASLVKLGVGSNGQILSSDSSQASGVKWANRQTNSADISGTIPINVGGTNATDAQTAINNLTQVSSATNEYVLTKDTGTGNATFKASASNIWTNNVNTDYLTTANHSAVIGTTAPINSSKLSILGTSDNVELTVKAASNTQASNIIEVLSNDNSIVFAVSRDTGATFGGTASNMVFTSTNTFISSDTTNKITFGVIGGENLRADFGTTANIVSLDSTTGVISLDMGSIGMRVVSLDAGSLAPIPYQLTFGSNITIDANNGNFQWVQLTGNPSNLNNIRNGKFGQKLIVMVSQDSTGSRKIGFGPATGSTYSFGNTITSYDASTTPGMHDYVGFIKGPVSWDVVGTDLGHR